MLPAILASLRLGMGSAWMSLIASEMTGAMSGPGCLIYNAAWQVETGLILSGMLAVSRKSCNNLKPARAIPGTPRAGFAK